MLIQTWDALAYSYFKNLEKNHIWNPPSKLNQKEKQPSLIYQMKP
jgi:hypothetical protein